MAEFKFEGDVEALAEPQKKLVESVLKKRGYKDGTVKVEQVGQKGDNYVAHVKRFIYEIGDGTTFKMVGKIAPAAEDARAMMNTVILFNNETIMYNEVLPKFNDLQNVVGVTENEKVRFPTCYGTVSEAPFEFILLEDLKESGFEMLDRFQPLSNESVRLVMKDLAIYHSLSYVFKWNEPETFKIIASRLMNMWTLMDAVPEAAQFFEILENDIKNLVDSDKYRKVISGSLSNIALSARKMQNYEKGSKYSVIQQGDCWNNNILFRLEDGKSVQNVMIDYQLSRECMPASDLLYLIFNCTDHATRLKHYHEWIDYYHEILDDSLANHGLKASRIFPKDQLDAELRRYGKMMVGLGVMLSSMLLRESKDVVDMKEMTGTPEAVIETEGITEAIIEDALEKIKTSSLDTSTIIKIKERIQGIIDSALEFGLV